MDLAEFQEILTDNRVEFVTIRVPHHGSGWQVNLRDGPGWACGVHCPTLTEALETSLANFKRDWGDKRAAHQQIKAASDDLSDLLG